jgi:UDP-glucose 4-epimerase
MKIYITGVAGFLGSYIAEEMLKHGHQVVGCDNLVGGEILNVPKGVEFHNFDMHNLDQLIKTTSGCDLIYHAACTAYEGLSVFSPSLVVKNTTQISVNAITAAVINRVRRFVHCSSMARYGTQDIVPFTENMVPKPQDPYGIAKYAAELILKNLSDVHGVELVIAVPHNIIGARQKYDDPYRNVASIMINLMLQGRQPIIYGDGSQERCFSSISDDIDCLVKLAFEDKAVGNIYNIGPDENPITILQLAEEIASILNFELDPVYYPGRPQEVKLAHCSANKIRKDFGYQTKVGLRECLTSMIEHIATHGTKKFQYHLPIEIINDQTPKTWTTKVF